MILSFFIQVQNHSLKRIVCYLGESLKKDIIIIAFSSYVWAMNLLISSTHAFITLILIYSLQLKVECRICEKNLAVIYLSRETVNKYGVIINAATLRPHTNLSATHVRIFIWVNDPVPVL